MLQPTVPKIMKTSINVENWILGKIEDHATVNATARKIWHNLAVEHLLSNTMERCLRFIQRLEFFRKCFDLYTECKSCRQGHHYSCSSKDRTNFNSSIVNIICTCRSCCKEKEQAVTAGVLDFQ
jgi:hypothetical protein